MKMYKDADSGKIIVEVYDICYLREKDHPYGWLKRHYLHFRLKFALYRADEVHVKDQTMKTDIVRYYFIPKEKIFIRSTENGISQKKYCIRSMSVQSRV